VRHLIAGFGLLGAVASAFLYYAIVEPSAANNGSGVFLVNAVWGTYYGLGFEPAFIWYRVHGPFPTGPLDLFAMIVYPLIASIILYVAIYKLSQRLAWRKWIVVALGLSFLVIIPMRVFPGQGMWLHPIWVFGAMSEPP
jgi:hypothetical protein